MTMTPSYNPVRNCRYCGRDYDMRSSDAVLYGHYCWQGCQIQAGVRQAQLEIIRFSIQPL